MKVFGRLEFNTNASFSKRFLAYFIDAAIIGLVKVFALQFMFMRRSSTIFTKFFDDFSSLFPDLKIENFSGIHIRYITSNPIYREVFLILLMLLGVTFLYRLVSYMFFRITLGQKLLGIRVVNNTESGNNKKMNLMQALSRSVLEFLPAAVMFTVAFLIPFNILNFYRYTVSNSGIIGIFTNLIKHSSMDMLFVVMFVYIFFWFNIYFFSNRFFLHDIITKTRVIDGSNADFNNNKSMEEEIVNKIDNSFSFLDKVRKYCFNLIKNVVNKIFKKCKRS